MSGNARNKVNEFENLLTSEKKGDKYKLHLFIAGMNAKSRTAIENLNRILEENLKDQYELEIIDIYQDIEPAKQNHIIATPTLLKDLPLPIRKFVGDMSDEDKILLGLKPK